MTYNKTQKRRGGSCGAGVCTIPQVATASTAIPQSGGSNCRIGVLNPRFGGRRNTKQKGAGCGCGSSKPMINLPATISQGTLTLGLKGGGCGCGSAPPKPPSTSELLQNGGACPCQAVAAAQRLLTTSYR